MSSIFLLIFLLFGCSDKKMYNDKNFNTKTQIYKEYAVSGPTDFSVNIGSKILQDGGNAMDAILAMQVAIGLSEMHASGLGGGGYILYFDKKSGKIISFDGREVAPINANRMNVFGNQQKDETKYRSEFGIQYIGVPGILKAMELGYNKFGTKKWNDLFEPTIIAAENGFKLENRLSIMYNAYSNESSDIKQSLKTNNNVAKNITLANTLKEIAKPNGVDSFYNEEIADKIVEKIQKSNGLMQKKDLVNYKAFEKDATCVQYKKYKICTRNSNFTILSAIKILEKSDLSSIYDPNDSRFIHLVSNAVSAAIANKRQYDEDGFIRGENIINQVQMEYVDKINNAQIFDPITLNNKSNKDNKLTGTTSFFAIDKDGNIAIIGSSVNGYFGSGIVANGIVMNNTMLDFSDCENCVNQIKSSSRPSSSISPIIVFDENNNPVFGASSAGGIRILTYVTSVIISMIDLNIDPQESINSIKYSAHNNGSIMIESRCDKKLKTSLEKLGHKVIVSDEVISGLVAFKITHKGILVGHEPRRWGASNGK